MWNLPSSMLACQLGVCRSCTGRQPYCSWEQHPVMSRRNYYTEVIQVLRVFQTLCYLFCNVSWALVDVYLVCIIVLFGAGDSSHVCFAFVTSGDSLSAAKETALMNCESWTYQWHRTSIYRAVANCITLVTCLSRFSDSMTSLVMNFPLGLQYQAWIASSWAGFKFSYKVVGCIQDINATITLLQITCLFRSCGWVGWLISFRLRPLHSSFQRCKSYPSGGKDLSISYVL